MKNFDPKAWFMPQAVIIIGTYNADGTPNAMNAAWAGQWDGDKIMISMGNHQTTVNLNANPDFTIAFATTETMVAADFVGVVSGRVGDGLLYRGQDTEHQSQRGVPCRGWQTGFGEDAPADIRSRSSWIPRNRQAGGKCFQGWNTT